LLNTYKRNANKRKRDTFQDRGKGTLLEGLETIEISKMSKYLLADSDAISLRTRFDFLASHYIISRGESLREVNSINTENVLQFFYYFI
jgi:hypothetical protein